MPPRCCQHCRYQPPTSASAILRHALLNATITQLQYFNDAVTRLTEGRSVAHLDQAINALFNAADPCLLRQVPKTLPDPIPLPSLTACIPEIFVQSVPRSRLSECFATVLDVDYKLG
uniref:PCM1_C domain-containing protein n=1 Tax=Steinernema glaseri TaxID=37863 RepID=A0A1I7YPA3_9BILA